MLVFVLVFCAEGRKCENYMGMLFFFKFWTHCTEICSLYENSETCVSAVHGNSETDVCVCSARELRDRCVCLQCMGI